MLNYKTDNGIYTSQEFLKERVEKCQGMKHSGLGGAKNSIKNVVRKATTMMIHSALRWPEQANKDLWPLALEHAVYLHNHTPTQETGRFPEEIWTQSKSSYAALQNS